LAILLYQITHQFLFPPDPQYFFAASILHQVTFQREVLHLRLLGMSREGAS
jgi:hypothetical protein